MESTPTARVAERGVGRLFRGTLAFVEREALLVAAVVAYAVGLLVSFPRQLGQDGWLTLVSGREIIRHGLPSHNTLTVWGHGVAWVDQQWLAQLGFYGAFIAGGMALVMLLYATLTVAGFAGALVIARRLGASSLGILLIAPPAVFVALWDSWHFRAQSFTYPLFVALLWLLSADSRGPSRKVLLALPLLAFWANLHGSVVLGVVLVILRGVTFAVDGLRAREEPRRWLARAAVLVAAAPACLLVSPYGTDLIGYYHRTLLNPTFTRIITEWQPLEWSWVTAPFYGLVLLALFLMGRCKGRLTAYEALALVVLAVFGFAAIRNVVWFSIASIALLPVALEGLLGGRAQPSRKARVNLILGLGSVLVLLVMTAVTSTRPASWFERRYPRTAATAIATAALQRPETSIFADEKHADWLLWLYPELRGRIALDARFELLSVSELQRMFDFRAHHRDGWLRALNGYGLAMLERGTDTDAIRALLAEPGARALYDDGSVVVILRPA